MSEDEAVDIEKHLNTWGPLTILLMLVVVLPLAGGVVVCIVHPETLSYSQFLSDVTKAAIGIGIAVGGKALKSGLVVHGALSGPRTLSVSPATAPTTLTPPVAWRGADDARSEVPETVTDVGTDDEPPTPVTSTTSAAPQQ